MDKLERKKSSHCYLCGRTFKRKNFLTRHMCILHKEATSLACDVGKTASTCGPILKERLLENRVEKPLQRETCNDMLSSRSDSRQHFSINLKGKHFDCPTCQKSFNQKQHLKSHLLIHTGEKPFQCEDCRKRFTLKRGLVRHLRIHTGEKLHECNFCHKKFSRSCTWQVHLRTHTLEKPYSCEVCQRKFSDRSNYIQHKSTHLSPNIKCPNCDRLFKTNRYLKKHMKLHESMKPSACSSCGESFKDFSSVKSHICSVVKAIDLSLPKKDIN